MMMYNYMCKLGVIVLATLRAFICSVDNPLRRLRESSALQLKVKKTNSLYKYGKRVEETDI